MTHLFPYVVADIGGTNARFGLVQEHTPSSDQLEVTQQHVYPCQAFSTLEELFKSYVTGLAGTKPSSACIAVAGPVLTDHIQMTNFSWGFSIKALKQQLALSSLEVINDFTALAYATPWLEKSDLQRLQAGVPTLGTTRAVVGPGTGLGAAGLINIDGHWHPLAGEGGHVSFTPQSHLEMEVRRFFEPDDVHLPVEHFVSGPGLVNLYKALAHINDSQCENLVPADISKKALTGNDATCVEAIQLFCTLLGRFAGDVCLMMGAFGGVYLGGGIVPRLNDDKLMSLLISSFQEKGQLQSILQDVPLYMITAPLAALDGAARWHYDSYLRSRG